MPREIKQTKPRIAITLGDPAGVGPETVAGAWAREEIHQTCRPLVVGHPEILRRAVELRETGAQIVSMDELTDKIEPSVNQIPCLACGPADCVDVRPGRIDARGGQAAFDAVVVATKLALAGAVDAVVTAPLHKQALHAAGHDYPGHTELLAEMCGVDDFAMMLYLAPGAPLRSPAGLAVVHVSLHTALRNVFDDLTQDAILAKARLADGFMRRMTGRAPRIGVCSLNPHGGEGGLFGSEEQTVIRPAVQRGLQEGLQLEGPLPTDSLMIQARDGRFDAVVAMYHDQGHIALKLMGMHRAVNVTLGLPIVRTSVAHGTAFDLAWQGRAEISSMVEAIRVAAKLSFVKKS